MGFSYFIAVLGLVVASALIGFILGGLHESKDTRTPSEQGGRSSVLIATGLAFVAMTQGMVLVGSGLIRPLWALYLLLAALPAAGGYVGRRLLARQLSRRNG